MRMTLNRSKLPSSVQTVPQHAPFRSFTAAPRSPRKRRMRKIDGIGYLIALKEEKEAIYQFASKLHIPTPPRDTLEVPVARDHEKQEDRSLAAFEFDRYSATDFWVTSKVSVQHRQSILSSICASMSALYFGLIEERQSAFSRRNGGTDVSPTPKTAESWDIDLTNI
uniref:Uncharacterized protein n=1 Tax=Coccidioides posadasii RMSCC 3488 TaxID=454284 RepID=A0A0J6IIJ2_COCPO|nr:hypothetical protein CPAG_07970 [Coccidioides posadasii RMSCC 3488]